MGVAAAETVNEALASELVRMGVSRLFGLVGEDTVAFVTAAAVLMIVACGASYLPARRVARVDPLLALRE